MEEAEKMAAVKKAYAEMILNTAKEAAERILAAERRALRFQNDLRSTKEEALAMLLRLKQMLDSKTTEAEITSLNQQRKIEELDAQLNEAEEIITDLRLDLKQVHDKLEKVENEKKQPLNELSMTHTPKFAESPTHEDKIKTSEFITIPSEDSGLEIITTSLKNRMPLNQTILEDNCGNAISTPDVEKYYAQDSGFASIVTRNKEPKQHRNGCTQRIHAIGRKLLDGNMCPSSDEENQNPGIKNGLIIAATDKDEGKCTVSCVNIMETDGSFGEVRRPVRARSVRVRKNRFGKDKATSCISFINSAKLPHSNSCYKSVFAEIVKKGKRKRASKCRSATLKSPLARFSEPCLTSPSFSGNVKSGEDQLKVTQNKLKMKSVPCLDTALRSIKPDADLISGLLDVSICTGTLNDCDLARSAVDNKGKKLTDESVLEKVDTTESLKVDSSYSKCELFDVPLTESDLKDLKTIELPDRSLSRAGNNRLLKYTFTRKPKKDLSNPDQNSSPVNSSVKRTAIEKQTSLPEPHKSNLQNESSVDSGLLAQVADQLISLSDKRWW